MCQQSVTRGGGQWLWSASQVTATAAQQSTQSRADDPFLVNIPSVANGDSGRNHGWRISFDDETDANDAFTARTLASGDVATAIPIAAASSAEPGACMPDEGMYSTLGGGYCAGQNLTGGLGAAPQDCLGNTVPTGVTAPAGVLKRIFADLPTGESQSTLLHYYFDVECFQLFVHVQVPVFVRVCCIIY